MKIEKIISKNDGLELELMILESKNKPKGVIQFSHGMAEHKERYYDFMKYLSEDYICIIHDHRGHGASIKNEKDLGYFYTKDSNFITEDLYEVTKYIKKRYPNLDIILFSHSMGTLVSRNYIKKYDNEIKKLILCGPPTYNPLTEVAILIAKISCIFGEKKPNYLLDKLTFGSYNKDNIENSWICSNKETVDKYNNDKLCGYKFTSNGFLNLYKLMKSTFNAKEYKIKNKNLEIFVIAGKDDPVIQNEKKFNDLIAFLNNIGYKNIESKLYNNKRHELLNEINNKVIYSDILNFIEK